MLLGAQAQTYEFHGMVADEKHEPLIGATVQVIGASKGATTDANGRFSFSHHTPTVRVAVSFVGFAQDTVTLEAGKMSHIMLKEGTLLKAVEVRGTATFMDDLTPIHTEYITEAELLKAACCNLSESFETNASVDVSFTDAVTGTKQISMLGLDGRYVQINRENSPLIRGLASRYGLLFVPGTWIQSIDVGKGAGSVVNGYESMTGQINLEFKKPEGPDKLYLNTYVNNFGRVEQNVNYAAPLSEKWGTAILAHGSYFGAEMDGNEDGFMDMPKSRQFNVLNRYKYTGKKVSGQWGVHAMTDDKAGGQLGFGFQDDAGTSPQYGFFSRTNRLELFGKTGLLFPEKPYKGWGFIYSAGVTDVKQNFGRNDYTGKEKTLYGNVIFQNIIGNSFHQYRTGVSFLLDDYREVYVDSLFSRTEKVPGVYYEYSYLPGDKFSLVIGGRADFHNLYGTFLTPRVHARYQPVVGTTLRASAGKGYRVTNIMAEFSQILISSRQLIVEEPLKPEESWNMGLSIQQEYQAGSRKGLFVVDYFYTTFINQVISDMDRDQTTLAFYNLDGQSFAHSFQIENSLPLGDLFTLKTAYKYYDVQATINGELRQQPFISRHRAFVNVGYATKYDIWQFDATLQWYGTKRIPDTSDEHGDIYKMRSFSPDFYGLNAQVSRKYRWGTVYLGGENILGFTQRNPILDPENPFGDHFDASMVWGPIPGAMVYAGYRYKIKNRNFKDE
jgi:outer membrane receptor for ferrienterochelin and colicins